MSPTRREFIKSVGIALLALVQTLDVAPSKNTLHERLRHCWMQFDWLAKQTRNNYEHGSQAQERLAADHRAALNDLVAVGALSAAAADLVHIAYQEAIFHTWRTSTMMTYNPTIGPSNAVRCFDRPTFWPKAKTLTRPQ